VWEKVASWSTKAAISLKRVKIEEKLLRRAYRNSRTFFGTVPTPTASSLVRARGHTTLFFDIYNVFVVVFCQLGLIRAESKSDVCHVLTMFFLWHEIQDGRQKYDFLVKASKC